MSSQLVLCRCLKTLSKLYGGVNTGRCAILNRCNLNYTETRDFSALSSLALNVQEDSINTPKHSPPGRQQCNADDNIKEGPSIISNMEPSIISSLQCVDCVPLRQSQSHFMDIPLSSYKFSISMGIPQILSKNDNYNPPYNGLSITPYRSFHHSVVKYSPKDESVAEKTAKVLKEAEQQETFAVKKEDAKPHTSYDTPISELEIEVAPKEEPKPAEVAPVAVKKSLGRRFIDELKHYYHGFRLLFIDVRVCTRFIWMLLNGKSLNRRQRRQLVRTSADIFRLVPFSVFIIVPFMEFLLPVALKLFPGMLPSTFSEEKKEEEKLRKKLKVKLEMAKFLQDTIEETALQRKGAKGEHVAEFAHFMEKIRSSGQQTSVEEILKFSKVFEDEITLDNLNYSQLRALCKLLEVPNLGGTTNFLRFQIQLRLRNLEADDKMIQKEGIDNMAVWELQEACRARGMRSLGVPTSRLKEQLQQWLDLHLKYNVPTSLLLLSRALYMAPELPAEEQLKATIASLPETTEKSAKVKISEVTADRVDNKAKLEIVRQEEEALKREEKERIEAEKKEEEEEKLKAQKAEEERKKREEMEVIGEYEEIKPEPIDLKDIAQPITPTIVDSAPEVKAKPEEVLEEPQAAPQAEVILTEGKEALKEAAKAEKESVELSSKDIEELEDALEQAAALNLKMSLEKEELETLKKDQQEYKETVASIKTVVAASGNDAIQETKGVQRLTKKVDKLISQLESHLEEIQEEKEELQETIEIKEVKLKRASSEDAEEIREQIDQKKENLVDINDLLLTIYRLRKVPDDDKMAKIVQVLDEDKDGKIDVTDALKVIELLGQENVKADSDQLQQIRELLLKEENIQKLEKEEKETASTDSAAEVLSVDKDSSPPSDSEVIKPSEEEILGDKAKDLSEKQSNKQ